MTDEWIAKWEKRSFTHVDPDSEIAHALRAFVAEVRALRAERDAFAEESRAQSMRIQRLVEGDERRADTRGRRARSEVPTREDG